MSKNSSPKTLGILAFAVLAMGGGATYYQYNTVQQANAKVTELEAQVPSQEDLERDLADSAAKLASFKSQIQHLEQSVPDVAYVPTLMKELEMVGIAHDIKVIGVRPAPQSLMPVAQAEGQVKKEKKDYAEIEIEVKGRGDYENIKKFLDALQKFPKVVAVKTISLAPQREMAGNGLGTEQLEATVNVTAFVFPFESITAANSANSNKDVAPAPSMDRREAANTVSETMTLHKGRGDK